jgi:outer membrane protein assembly factor BamB
MTGSSDQSLRPTRARAIAGCLLALVLAGPCAAQEWTRFRGPNGSGISAATTVPVSWTEKDYHWKVDLPGRGHSSPVLWGDKVFVTSGDEATGKRILLCLSTRDGRRLWTREFPGPKHAKHTDNSFASATPAVDGQRVYTCWGSPQDFLVLALDHAGQEVWRADLGPFRSGHGFGASPIIHENLLIVPEEQDGRGAVVALEWATGKVRWKVARRTQLGYATPCLFQPAGRPAELILNSYEHGITALDPRTGRLAWEVDVFSKGHVEGAIASPVVAGDLVLGTCGWLGVKYETIAVRPYPRPEGAAPATAYRVTRSVPLVPTPLVKDDLLFLWTDGGIVTCAEAGTGEKLWMERVPGTYYASPVWAGGHLYSVSREGDVVVLAASRAFRLEARNPLGEGSHSTPAVAGERMYLRSFTHLLSVGGKATTP